MLTAEESESQLDPERWVEEHGDYLLGYAMLRMRNRAMAEDAVQEALLTALKSRDRFRGESSVRTWLTGILKYKTLEALRKHSREVSADGLDAPSRDEDFDERGHLRPGSVPEEIPLGPRYSLERKEFYQTLSECLSKLPERVGQAFVSIELDSHTPDEVAENLMIKKNNLYVLLHRARKGLRGCLEKNWFHEQQSDSSNQDLKES